MKAFFAKAERKVLSRIMKKLTGNSLKDKDMKKIYSFALAAVALLSAASCQKELVDNTIENQGGDFTVTAVASVESKTVLVDGVKTFWTPGDKISVFNAEGKSVAFSTNITANAASAKFTNTATFDAPATLYAAYPDRGGVQALADGIINNFRIAGTQTAVAGSFDPTFGSAVGIEGADGKLEFKSIHALIKFTIGGEKAPSKVTFTNGGARNIAGLFTYNTTTGKIGQGDGAKAISLVPAAGQNFEIGKTYYIAVISGGNFANMTLDFDGTVVKTVEGAKYADESNGYLLGKIINLGTVSFPVEGEKPTTEETDLTATRLWVKTFAELGLSNNGARNCATDGEYVFVPNSAGSPITVKAFPVDGGAAVEVNMTGVEGGTHPTSCVRMIANTDASINGGKDILLLTNLGISSTINLYAYTNGIENAPVKIQLLNTWRRQGDKFTVTGSWQSGELRFPDWNSGANAVVRFPISNGAIATGQWSVAGCWDPIGKFNVTNGGISEFVTYPGSTANALVTTTSTGTFNTSADGVTFSQSAWGSDPKLAMTFGYNFVEIGGSKYIAYARLDSSKANGSLNVIEDKGSAEEFKNSLETQNKKLTAAVLDADSATTAGSSICDCDVVVKDGKVYAAVLIDNCGLAYFQIQKK